jgi:hypothetical protein
MSMKAKNLRPGDKVRITQDDVMRIDDIAFVVIATKGSIGIVIPQEEYSDFIRRRHWDSDCTDHLAWVKLETEAGRCYPIRIDEFMPYQHDDMPPTYVECQVGYITVLDSGSLKKIKRTYSKTK